MMTGLAQTLDIAEWASNSSSSIRLLIYNDIWYLDCIGRWITYENIRPEANTTTQTTSQRDKIQNLRSAPVSSFILYRFHQQTKVKLGSLLIEVHTHTQVFDT